MTLAQPPTNSPVYTVPSGDRLLPLPSMTSGNSSSSATPDSVDVCGSLRNVLDARRQPWLLERVRVLLCVRCERRGRHRRRVIPPGLNWIIHFLVLGRLGPGRWAPRSPSPSGFTRPLGQRLCC